MFLLSHTEVAQPEGARESNVIRRDLDQFFAEVKADSEEVEEEPESGTEEVQVQTSKRFASRFGKSRPAPQPAAAPTEDERKN
jgi:hypothetical protein